MLIMLCLQLYQNDDGKYLSWSSAKKDKTTHVIPLLVILWIVEIATLVWVIYPSISSDEISITLCK
jgi:hypothetical protein